MNVTVDQVLALLGSKEVELAMLKNVVANLQDQVKKMEDEKKVEKEKKGESLPV